jgi:nucleoside-triphosphatase THEP1
MLGYMISTGRGAGDRLMVAVADRLVARGMAVAGVVQLNVEHDPERHCHMDLQILGRDDVLRISEDRGRHARGCRLDPRGLADAVQRVDSALDQRSASLLIVNKFGKQEAQGGGFREVIGRALIAGIPVLTTVSQGNLAAFLDFAEGLASEVAPDADAAVAWCVAAADPLTAPGIDA